MLLFSVKRLKSPKLESSCLLLYPRNFNIYYMYIYIFISICCQMYIFIYKITRLYMSWNLSARFTFQNYREYRYLLPQHHQDIRNILVIYNGIHTNAHMYILQMLFCFVNFMGLEEKKTQKSRRKRIACVKHINGDYTHFNRLSV